MSVVEKIKEMLLEPDYSVHQTMMEEYREQRELYEEEHYMLKYISSVPSVSKDNTLDASYLNLGYAT